MSKTDLEDLGEEIEDLANGFSKYRDELMQLTGFDIIVEGTTDTYKDLYEIFDGLAGVWDNLSDTVQSRVSEILGGTRQLQVISSILNNWDDAADAYAEAMDSANVATEANERYMETISARISVFEASVQELYNDFLSSDLVASIVDLGTKLVNILDSLIDHFGSLSVAILGITVGTAFSKVLSALSKLNKDGNQAITVMNVLQTAFSKTATAASGATGALNKLNAVLSANKITLLVTAVAALAAGFTYLTNRSKKAEDALKETMTEASDSADAWAEANDSLNDYIERINELRTALDDGTLSEEDSYDAKSELLDIQGQLYDSYGTLAEGIDLVNGDLQTQIDLLKGVSQQYADSWINDNYEAIQEANKVMESSVEYSLTGSKGMPYSGFAKSKEEFDAFNKLVDEKYGDYIDITTDKHAFTIDTYLTFKAGDPEEAYEVLDSLMTDLRGLLDNGDLEQTGYIKQILEYVEEYRAEMSDTLEMYQNVYDQAQQATLISDSVKYSYEGQEKYASEWLNEYSDAVSAYNIALSNGESEAIESAKETYEYYYNALHSFLDDAEQELNNFNYGNMVSSIEEQLSSTSAIIYDFINGTLDEFDESRNEAVVESLNIVLEANIDDQDLKALYINPENSNNSQLSSAIEVLAFNAEKAGISFEDDLIPALVKYGYVAGQVSSAEPITFLELLKDEDFNDTIDDFQSDMDKLQGYLDDLSSGKGVNFTDATQEFNELAGSADNLDEAIEDLKWQKILDFSKDWKTATAGLTGEDLENANQMFNDILFSVDLSDIDYSEALIDVKTLLLDNLGDMTTTEMSTAINELGDSIEAQQVMAALVLNPDSANWTYEQWVEYVESGVITVSIQASEKDIEALDNQLAILQSKLDTASAEVSYKESTGQAITEDNYQEQLDIINEMIELYDGTDGYLEKSQAKMDLYAERYGEDSASYATAFQEYQKYYQSYLDLLMDQYKYSGNIEMLPIDELETGLGYLQAENNLLNSNINYREALGETLTAEDYQKVYDNYEDQVKILETMVDHWQSMLSTMDESDPKWEEYTNNLVDATDELTEVTDAMNTLEETMSSLTPATTAYDLFFNQDGSASEFSESVDEFQDYIDTINGIIESVRNGEEINIADLMQDYDISGDLDTLEQELSQLSADKFVEFATDYKEAISSISDPEQLAKVQKFMASLISTLDLSSIFDSNEYRKTVYDALMESTGGNVETTLALMTEELNDVISAEALYEVAVAFDLSNLSMKEIEELVENQTYYINIQASNESITALDKQLQLLQLEASNVSSNLSLKETQGDIITEEDYQEQIDLAEKMLELYEGSDEYNGLISEYEETWNEAVEKYGEDSAVALEAMEDYYNAIGERNDILADLYGYYEDQAELPINTLDHELDALETENDELQYNIDLKEAMGEAITAEDYQAINDNLEEQNQKYAEQIEIWKEMQSGVTEGGSYWWEYQSNIDSATAAIEKNTLATIENEETIANLTPATNTYDLFYNVNGDASDFSQTVDDFQSDMSSITSTLESLREGEEVDLTDLVQEFGELDLSAENLEDALLDLQATKLRDFVNEWNESTAEMDTEELEYARQLLIDLLGSMDFSDMDLTGLFGGIYNNLVQNGIENASQFTKELAKYYGNNAEAMELIYKLSFVLDTDNIEDYEKYMEKNGITVMVHPKLDELNEFEATLDAETAEWFNSLDEFDQELVYNISVRADNTSLWTIDKWQQELLDMQNAAKTSEESIQDFYDVINGETDDTFRSTIDDYISQFETLQDVLDQISMGTFSEQDALSLALDIPQLSGYTNDINGLKQAIQNLLNTSKQDILDAFNEQIEAMGGASTAAGQALTELLGDIMNLYGAFGWFDIDEEIEKFGNYNTARDNSVSATGLTTSDITNLTAMYSDLPGYDASKLFEKTANGVHLNEVEVEKLQNSYEELTKTKLDDKMNELQKEYNESVQAANALFESNEMLSQSAVEAALAEQGIRSPEAIANDIEDTGILISQYDGLVSAFNKYTIATSAANERDSFATVASGYESVKSLIEQGWGGDEEVETYLDLLIAAEKRTGDAATDFMMLDETIEGTAHSLHDYFTYDEDNNLTSAGLFDLLDDVNSLLGEDYVWWDDGVIHFDFSGDKLQEVADALGTTPEMLEIVVRALADTGAAVNMGTDYMSQLEQTTYATARSLKELQDSGEYGFLDDLDLNFDATTASAEELEGKIEELDECKASIPVDAEGAEEAMIAIEEYEKALQNQLIALNVKTVLDNEELEYSLEDLEDLLELEDEDLVAEFGIEIDPETNPEEFEEAVEEIRNLISEDVILEKIKVQLENGETIENLLALSDEDLAETFEIDANAEDAEAEIAAVRSALESMQEYTDVEVPMTVKIDETQFEALTSENVSVGANTEQFTTDVEAAKTAVETSDPAQVPVGADVEDYNSTIDSAESATENNKVFIPVSADIYDFKKKTSQAKSDLESNISYIDVDAHTNLLTQSIDNALSGTRYINVVAKTSQTSDGSASKAMGTAHATGTAYQKWVDQRHAVGAYANGSTQDWALPQNENALVNELGNESIIRDGKWQIIPGGAHVEALKKGDIVFNKCDFAW